MKAALAACALLAACAVDPNTPKGGIPVADWQWIAGAVNPYPAAEWVDQHVRWSSDAGYCERARPGLRICVADSGPEALTLYISVPWLRATYPSDPVWTLWHEIGHTIKPSGLTPEERWANCAATALIGRHRAGTPQCDSAGVNAARAHLDRLGIPHA